MLASLLLAATVSGLTHITIDAKVDPTTRTITATEMIRLDAQSSKTVDLDLRLSPDPTEKALMHVDALSIDGKEITPSVMDDGATLRVEVPSVESTIAIRYRGELLESERETYGYYLAESAEAGSHWYPLPKDVRFANFDVAIEHPAKWTLLTSGFPTEATATRERSRAEHVEGFAFALGEGFERQELEGDGLKVVAFFPPAKSATFVRIARSALDAASWYKKTYGFFPARQIGIVPGYATAAGGWPLPNIFMVHQQVLDDEFITAITAHELGHYYWGLHVLGADERLSWVMLANGIWIDQKYLAAKKNIPLIEQWRDSAPTAGGFMNFLVEYTTAISGGYDQCLGITKAEERALPYNYNSYVRHGKGSAGVILEAARIGDEKFIEFQRGLLRDYAYRPLDAETFAKRLEDAGVAGAREFFKVWSGPGHIDYSVADVSPSGGETEVTVTRQGAIALPVVVEVTDGSGKKLRKTIDGKERMTKVSFATTTVQTVALDPDGVIPMWGSSNAGMQRAFLKGAFNARLDGMFRPLAVSYLAEHPDAGDVRYLLATSLMRGGDAAGAAEASRIAAIQTTHDCRLQCLQSRALFRRGDADGSRRAFAVAESSPVCAAVPSEIERTRREIQPAK